MMAIDAELHADEEALLLEEVSNIDRNEPGFIEFDSMINLRPSQGNRSRGVDDPEPRKKILAVVPERIA